MTNNHTMHESSHNKQYVGFYLQRWNETKYTHTFFLINMSISSGSIYLTTIVTM